jgi:metallo-beta-lactamase family protein
MTTNTQNSWGNITFHGAAGDVTGANFLLDIADRKILVDCGLSQGDTDALTKNYTPFAYTPADIHVLIVTHAHTDHIGRIPKLIHDGFRGVIYSTAPTREIAALMFDDALDLMEREALENNLDTLYNRDDITHALGLWKTVPYHSHIDLGNSVSGTFFDAGHVLGSAMCQISYNNKHMLFTGDLGNTPNILLKDTEEFMTPDIILTESVYGDRNHEHVDDREQLLEDAIEDTVKSDGVLMIPSFSLERTQEILFSLNHLVEAGRIPKIPIYLDSPLAIRITEVYRRYTEFLKPEVRNIIKGGDDVFDFPGLHITGSVDDSKAINQMPGAKVIIAGSGMMNGGRILHHAKNYLSGSHNMLLLVGYQAHGTLGRMLYDGAKHVKIHGVEVDVQAEIRMITGFSGHKGSDQLVEFIRDISDNAKQVFCVMGDPTAANHLAGRIRDEIGVPAEAPIAGESREIVF